MQKKNIGQLLEKKLSDFKLLALDMDGTGLNSKGQLPEELIKFINNTEFNDLNIVFATGRMPIAVNNSLGKLDISKVVISHNGAVISNLESNEIFYKSNLSDELVKFSLKLHKELNVPLHLNLMNSVITDKLTKLSNDYAQHLEIKIDEVDLSKIEEEVISLLFIAEKDKLQSILNKIENSFADFSYVLIPDRKNWLLQLLPKETSKGRGVLKYSEILNITKEEVISFGDSFNDLEMIKNSGMGIAMGNACRELKDVADYVTSTNDDNGVLEVLQKIL